MVDSREGRAPRRRIRPDGVDGSPGGGRIVTTATVRASTNGMECATEKVHCVTNDARACPMLAPLPPWWCADGTRVAQPSFIPSADGKECSLPSIHCVTEAADACVAYPDP